MSERRPVSDGGVASDRDGTGEDAGFGAVVADDTGYQLPYTDSGTVPTLGTGGTLAWAARVVVETPVLAGFFALAGVALALSNRALVGSTDPVVSALAFGGAVLGTILVWVLAARYAAVYELGGDRDLAAHLVPALRTLPYVVAVLILLNLGAAIVVTILAYGLGLAGLAIGWVVALYLLFHTFLAVSGAAIERAWPTTAVSRAWAATTYQRVTVLGVVVATAVVVAVADSGAGLWFQPLWSQGVGRQFLRLVGVVPWWALGALTGLATGWAQVAYARLYLQGQA